MGSYFMQQNHLHSGYDEYAGIFGPLQPVSSSAYQPRGRLPPSRRGFVDSRSRDLRSNVRKGRRSAPRDFDRRANFLAARKTKRAIERAEGDSDGAEDLQDKENDPTSPTHGLERQVWLPTRNFAFRQRAGKLDTRAIARLDLEKIAATTDVETIQRHLENLAFADVTLDDVQHYSDAYFLKLFQIAQLTLEYLMHVQDSLVDHSEGLEQQCDQLMTECQQLETENGQHETEISSLKREIRQKQRTMATLELMLLNASTSNRTSCSAKERAARGANVLVEELLANHADREATEEGAIANPVSCVLCKKRFVSAEYLLRHQQRRHQDAAEQKKKKKPSPSSGSSSESDSKTRKKTSTKPAPLPKEVLDALDEKNQLARQLVALQDQVRVDQEARERQRQQLENQQTQMSSRVESYMDKLHATLAEIEKKQEATKQDLRQYTQEAITRLQVEAANAELMRIQAQKISRAGRLEDDNGEASQSKSEDARWSEKVEKLMDTFLRAQAQKQQEIDALEQESSKLWTKYNKLKKRQHRPEPTVTLADLTALDTERFGVDRGEVVEEESLKPVKVERTAFLEDKLVQTDEEDDDKRFRRQPSTLTHEGQVDAEPKATAVAVQPIRVEAVERILSPPPQEPSPTPTPTPEKKEILVEASAPVEEKDSKPFDSRAKFQQAAQIIGKVALGFLARRALAKTSNWRVVIDISSLEAALTAPELEYAHQHYKGQVQVQVQVEEGMTANDLRVLIARVLSGRDEFEAPASERANLELTATMTYHRVLLHHKRTGVELCGEMPIHELKNGIEVELIPYHQVTAIQVHEVIESHAMTSDRIKDIKRVSVGLSASDLPLLEDGGSRDGKATLPRIVRLQALARGFLARKEVGLMTIDRIVDARLVQMKSSQSERANDTRTLEPSWMSVDPVLAAQYEKVQRRLAQALRAKLQQDGGGGHEDLGALSSADLERYSADLGAGQKSLSSDAQRRIELLTERLPPMATGEFRRRESDAKQGVKSRTTGAAKIHRAVQVEVVRKRLKRLLAAESTHKRKVTVGVSQPNSAPPSAATNALLSSWLSVSRESRQNTGKSIGSFDPREIDQLANAYEEGKSPVEIEKSKASEDQEQTLPDRNGNHEDEADEAQEEKPRFVQPLTPRAELEESVDSPSEEKPTARPGTPNPYADANRELVDEAGRSPRPNTGVHTISPFSQTPLISRRASARRGTGFDNAR